jgi:hypothetical protein
MCRESSDENGQHGQGSQGWVIARIAVRLRGPSGPVVLLREGRLPKLREELVEAI